MYENARMILHIPIFKSIIFTGFFQMCLFSAEFGFKDNGKILRKDRLGHWCLVLNFELTLGQSGLVSQADWS